MKGYLEIIERSEPQLDPYQHIPEPRHLVWSLTVSTTREERNFRLLVEEFFS